jgi:hypothetical protein
MDFAYVLLMIVFVAASLGLVRFCASLAPAKEEKR